jgi:hypothetical protein
LLDRPFDGRVGAPTNSIAPLNGLSVGGFSHNAKAVEGKSAEARTYPRIALKALVYLPFGKAV